MPVAGKRCKHHMYELDIAIVNKVVAGNDMPAIVPVMALTTFAYVDGCFDFQTFALATICVGIDEVGIALIMVVLVG